MKSVTEQHSLKFYPEWASPAWSIPTIEIADWRWLGFKNSTICINTHVKRDGVVGRSMALSFKEMQDIATGLLMLASPRDKPRKITL